MTKKKKKKKTFISFVSESKHNSNATCSAIITSWLGFPGGSVVKNLPMQDSWVQFLGREDPLEKEMATHSNILAWEIPWTEGPRGLQSMGLQRVGHNLATKQQLRG